MERGYRYGGEEFCVVMPGRDLGEACAVLERMRIAVTNAPFTSTSDQPVKVTLRHGVVTYDREDAEPASLAGTRQLPGPRCKTSRSKPHPFRMCGRSQDCFKSHLTNATKIQLPELEFLALIRDAGMCAVAESAPVSYSILWQ